MHTLVIGAGYSGSRIAALAAKHGTVFATRRSSEGVASLSALGINADVLDGNISLLLEEQLAKATHIVLCVAPDRDLPFNDPIYSLLGKLADSKTPSLEWLGYLSTIGVYGNHDGRWVDESVACTSSQTRSQMRIQAEKAWEHYAVQRDIPLSILRLSGIYGPGKNAVEDALRGKARILNKRHQVFNRIHVNDLARATLAAAMCKYHGVLNITDDVPAAPQHVVHFAHALCDRISPQEVPFESAQISPMARSFYSENKRVLNSASKRILNFRYEYPNYRQGLSALWNEINEGIKT